MHITLGWLHSQLIGNYSARRTTRLATKQSKDAPDPRDKPARNHAAGHPPYISSPRMLDLPSSSRTPPVTPHAAPTRHQPRQSTVSTAKPTVRNSVQGGKPKLVPVKVVSGVLLRGKSRCNRTRCRGCLRRHCPIRKSRWVMADCGERRAGLDSLRRRDRCCGK